MFKTRLISGIFLVLAALLTIISGGYVLFVTLLCVSLLGIQELYKAMGVHKDGVGLLELAGYLGAILYYASLLLGFERYGMMAVLLGLVLLMFVYVFTYPKYTWRDLCGCDSWTGSGICSDLCSRCTDLYGRRSCCICDQEKSRHQGLRQADPGTWRHP